MKETAGERFACVHYCEWIGKIEIATLEKQTPLKESVVQVGSSLIF